MIPLSDPYFPADLQPRARDVEGAKALLAEAGYPDGLEIPHPLISVFGFGTSNLAAVLKEQLAEAGITISLARGRSDLLGHGLDEGAVLHPRLQPPPPLRSLPPDLDHRRRAVDDPLVERGVRRGGAGRRADDRFRGAEGATTATAIRLQSENDGIILPAYAPRLHAKAATLQGVVAELRQLLRFHRCLFRVAVVRMRDAGNGVILSAVEHLGVAHRATTPRCVTGRRAGTRLPATPPHRRQSA